MSTTNTNVTPGKIFVPDSQGRVLLTIDDLNRLGAPTVTIEKTDSIASEDIQDAAIVEAKLGTGAVTADKIGASAVTAAKLANTVADAIETATVTVGASVARSNPILVAIQLKDIQGNALSEVCAVRWWISDANFSTGAHIVPSATIPDQALAYTLGYYAVNIAASTVAQGITDGSGRLHLTFQHNAGALTRYIYVVVGNKLIQGSIALAWT